MCERKAKKDPLAAVVSRALCMFRAPPVDTSRLTCQLGAGLLGLFVSTFSGFSKLTIAIFRIFHLFSSVQFSFIFKSSYFLLSFFFLSYYS